MRIHGFHPVREALRSSPRRITRILIGRHRKGRRANEIESLARRQAVTCERVPEARLEELSPGVHNGFVAELEKAGVGKGGPSGDPELIVLLEDVQDPRNLGAILRVCEGAGVGRVLVRDRGSAPISATVVKTSAGAAEWLSVERVPNTANAIRELKEEGFWVYGADAAGDLSWDIDLGGKVVLCLGGEEKGLRARTRKECDRLIALPMRGRVESLNVATAAAAILYEALRQRSS